MWWEKMVPIESPSRMAAAVTSAISLAHTTDVDLGDVHLRLDRLDVDGDRRLGHPGERAAQHPQQLVAVRPDGVGLDHERR